MENYQENSKRTKRVVDASTVIGFLASQSPVQPELPFEPPTPEPVQHGFNMNGDYV